MLDLSSANDTRASTGEGSSESWGATKKNEEGNTRERSRKPLAPRLSSLATILSSLFRSADQQVLRILSPDFWDACLMFMDIRNTVGWEFLLFKMPMDGQSRRKFEGKETEDVCACMFDARQRRKSMLVHAGWLHVRGYERIYNCTQRAVALCISACQLNSKRPELR